MSREAPNRRLWRLWRRRQVRKWFPMAYRDPVPKGWADGIIWAWKRTGAIERMAKAAILHSKLHGRIEDAEFFQAIADQFRDFSAQ
jgi:hypothetical protein